MAGMKIQRNGLVGGAYRVAYGLANMFWCRGDHIPENTDLCTVIRVIFVTAPLAVALNIAAVGLLAFGVAVFLAALIPHLAAVGVFALIVLGFASVLGLILFVAWLSETLAEKEAVREVLDVTSEYIKARKSSICPLIELETEQ